jgi:hypothetical protein
MIETPEQKRHREQTEADKVQWVRDVEADVNRRRLNEKVLHYRNAVRSAEAAALGHCTAAVQIKIDADTKAQSLLALAEEIEAGLPSLRERLAIAERESNAANLTLAERASNADNLSIPTPARQSTLVPRVLGI